MDRPPRLAIGAEPLTPRSIARIIQTRAKVADYTPCEFAGHSLKLGALTAGMEPDASAAQLKRPGRNKNFDVLGEYLESGGLFESHALEGLL
jgi:hypothetical protein